MALLKPLGLLQHYHIKGGHEFFPHDAERRVSFGIMGGRIEGPPETPLVITALSY